MTSLRSVCSAKLGVFLRYGAGSLVAMGCSEIVLVGSYGLLRTGPLTASVLAWFAGAVPNYVLNRRWAWRSDRAGSEGGGGGGARRGVQGRKLALYWSITLVTAAAAVAATTGMDGWIKAAVSSRGEQSLLLALAYLSAYGVVFIAKFVLFDRLVFNDGRSRSRIPSAAEAASENRATATSAS